MATCQDLTPQPIPDAVLKRLAAQDALVAAIVADRLAQLKRMTDNVDRMIADVLGRHLPFRVVKK